MTTVSIAEKRRVPSSFDRVARAYDLLTALNPGYRKHLELSASRLGLSCNAKVLDLCCGTGLSTAAIRRVYPNARLTALDASPEMLARAGAKPELAGVRWVEGDATDPARAGVRGRFDAVLVAYGIRNIPDPDRCLRNVFELLEPGGRLCVHEYSVADSPVSTLVWNAVTCGVVIPSGLLLAGSTEIFRYLRRSVLEFDGVSAFEDRLARAGFDDVRTLPMTGWQRGVVHSFVARRPA